LTTVAEPTGLQSTTPNRLAKHEVKGELGPGERYRGEYLIGIDFSKHADHSAIAVLEKIDDSLRLVHLKELPLETSYTAII
jgi:hypothetical protein